MAFIMPIHCHYLTMCLIFSWPSALSLKQPHITCSQRVMCFFAKRLPVPVVFPTLTRPGIVSDTLPMESEALNDHKISVGQGQADA